MTTHASFTAPSGRTFALGRIVVPDERDHEFLMATVAPAAAPTASRMWDLGPVLDQHQTPHCVAFAWGQFLQTAPILTALKPLGGGAFLDRLYMRSRTLDGITGRGGSSVRGGAKAVQGDGRLASYVWGYDVDTIRRFILSTGPVVMGTDWYASMFDPTPDGYLVPSGHVVGGHAWLLSGYDAARDAFQMINSWGAGWGNNGTAWVRAGDLRVLLNNGEACSAVEYVPAVPGGLDRPRHARSWPQVSPATPAAPASFGKLAAPTNVHTDADAQSAPVPPSRAKKRRGGEA